MNKACVKIGWTSQSIIHDLNWSYFFCHLRIFGGRFILPRWYCHEMADKRSSLVALQYPKLPSRFSPPWPHICERLKKSVDLPISTQNPEYVACCDEHRQAAWWGVPIFLSIQSNWVPLSCFRAELGGCEISPNGGRQAVKSPTRKKATTAALVKIFEVGRRKFVKKRVFLIL